MSFCKVVVYAFSFANIMEWSYKTEHEDFVSNLNGTLHPGEVLMASSITEITMIAVRAVSFQITGNSPFWWFQSIAESFLMTTPYILAVTVLNEHLMSLAFILLALATAGLIGRRKLFKSGAETVSSKSPDNHRITFVSQLRSHLLLDTSISILAVDFVAYPRRFAKTETFGWSLMDVGVGAFVMVAGLVAPETRPTTKLKQWQNVWKTATSSAGLVLLGLLRILVTRRVNYHEHVTEYGAHWNFFLTLAVTRVVCSCILLMIPVQYVLHLSICLISTYQFALSNLGLTEFLFSADRRTILEANKEGIFSLIGYISSYLAAVHIGRFIAKHKDDKIKLFSSLLMGGMGLYFAMHLSCFYIQPVSRRICNLSFCLWAISISCFKLAGHLAIDTILFKDDAQCAVITAVNKNGLLFFLIGNVLTGIVNLSVKTLSSSAFETVTILIAYTFLCSTVILAVHRYRSGSERCKNK